MRPIQCKNWLPPCKNRFSPSILAASRVRWLCRCSRTSLSTRQLCAAGVSQCLLTRKLSGIIASAFWRRSTGRVTLKVVLNGHLGHHPTGPCPVPQTLAVWRTARTNRARHEGENTPCTSSMIPAASDSPRYVAAKTKSDGYQVHKLVRNMFADHPNCRRDFILIVTGSGQWLADLLHRLTTRTARRFWNVEVTPKNITRNCRLVSSWVLLSAPTASAPNETRMVASIDTMLLWKPSWHRRDWVRRVPDQDIVQEHGSHGCWNGPLRVVSACYPERFG